MKWTKTTYVYQGKARIQYESEEICPSDYKVPLSFVIDEYGDDSNYREVGIRSGSFINRLADCREADVTVAMEWCRAYALSCFDVKIQHGHVVTEVREKA